MGMCIHIVKFQFLECKANKHPMDTFLLIYLILKYVVVIWLPMKQLKGVMM